MSMQSAEELRVNLAQYQEQLDQVEKLLLMDHQNAEYQGLYDNLREVIALTTDLLAEAEASQEGAAAPALASSSAAPPQAAPVSTSEGLITSAPAMALPSVLPPQVARQIRAAQQKAALMGQAPPAWAIGALVEALYVVDGEWYPAAVEAVTASNNFLVVFEGYGNKEEVTREMVRPRSDADIVEEEPAYMGVSAPKRNKVEEEPTVTEMPPWLEIKETDDEKTRAKKRKLQKSYKNKMRFAKMDMAQKDRQKNWLNFVQGKGAKKKPGLKKKESMFRVPDAIGAKVGVIGSGKGTTQYYHPARHEFRPTEDDE